MIINIFPKNFSRNGEELTGTAETARWELY